MLSEPFERAKWIFKSQLTDSVPLAAKSISEIPQNMTPHLLTTCVPGCPLLALHIVPQALLHIGLRFAPREDDLAEESNVGNGQPQCVDLGETLLIRKGGYMAPELIEG